MKISIVSSSTRPERLTHRLALLLNNRLGALQHEVELHDLKELNFPFIEYTYDKHPSPPKGLKEFKESISSSDAVIFVSPEYNGSFAPALKNAVDYLAKSDFTRKPIGVALASPGVTGGIRGAHQLQLLILGLWGIPVPQMLLMGGADKKLSQDGELIDPSAEKQVDSFLNEFLWMAEALAEKKKTLALA